MFAEWFDDNDIDNYYDDLVFTDIQPASSANEYQKMHPVFNKVELPIGEVVNTGKNSAEAVAPIKSSFDNNETLINGLPNSMFDDDHPVGSQPKINILRSADRENYCNKRLMNLTSEWVYIIIVIIAFLTLILMYINVKSQLCSTRITFEMLMRLYCSKIQQNK